MMNEDALKYAEQLVPRSYVDLARQARRSHEQQIRSILEHRKLPDQPLNENLIEQWLHEIAQMDSNNFDGNVGVGEREGNIISLTRTESKPAFRLNCRSHIFIVGSTTSLLSITWHR